jgi:hypothetical protein
LTARKVFEAMAEELLARAGRLPCTPEEYVEGLLHIIDVLQVSVRDGKTMIAKREGG